MDKLRKTVAYYSKANELIVNELLDCFTIQHLKKGEFLLEEGQICNHIYYLSKGCIYYYYSHGDQNKVLDFHLEGNLFNEYYSFLKETPSFCMLKTCENSEVFKIKKSDFERLCDKHHSIERFCRKLLEQYSLRIGLNSSLKTILSNEQRYLRLVNKRPNLIQRVPQYLIASYLGLTPTGLSKIRKRLSQKSNL